MVENVVEAILEIIKSVIPTAQLQNRKYGVVHNSNEAEINGIKGVLVWDSILFHEITFDDMNGNIITLFTSRSEEETKAKWDELVNEYGIERN